MRAFTNVQLLQEFLSNYQSELLKSPINVIQIFSEILSTYNPVTTRKSPSSPTISNLSQIVVNDEDEDEDDGNEFLEMALTLLSTITAESIQRELSQEEIESYKSCLSSLTFLLQHSDNQNHKMQARGVIHFINVRIEMTSPQVEEKGPESDEEMYSNAMEYISDSLVPIRAQGISIIRTLIQRTSPVINIDSVLDTLIGLLKDEDSFVYLNAIKTIQQLANTQNHEKITRKILSKYESPSKNVDERLRLAETLAGIIQRENQLFTGSFAQEVISRNVSIVSMEKEWRIRVSALGLISICVEIAPQYSSKAIEMALHLFKLHDLTFAEEDDEGEGAAPLKRGAVNVISGILRGGGIDSLGEYTREVLRSIRYLAASDGDEGVKELAAGVLEMLRGVVQIEGAEKSRWSAGGKIQEL